MTLIIISRYFNLILKVVHEVLFEVLLEIKLQLTHQDLFFCERATLVLLRMSKPCFVDSESASGNSRGNADKFHIPTNYH